MSEVKVYDDLIDKEVQNEVYNWVQSVSWYCSPLARGPGPMARGFKKPTEEEIEQRKIERKKFLATVSDKSKIKEFPIQEYNPTLMGKSPTRPQPTDEKLKEKYLNLPFSMYRHPIGWDEESLKRRSPIIWNLWTQINNKIFDAKATVDGMEEGHMGIHGPPRFFVDSIDFYKKYNVPRNIKKFTSMVNARATSLFRPTNTMESNQMLLPHIWGKHLGQVHKDSDNTFSDKHFTVLYLVNLEWFPHLGGEIKFYDNQYTGYKHWKHGYDIGWPCDLVGHRPNRIIVFSHNQIHDTYPPNVNASEMTQKIAFRVKVK